MQADDDRTDPRSERTRLHCLRDILTLSIRALTDLQRHLQVEPWLDRQVSGLGPATVRAMCFQRQAKVHGHGAPFAIVTRPVA